MSQNGLIQESFNTKSVTAGNDPEEWKARDLVPPISVTTTFKQPSPGVFNGYDYTRHGNPTRCGLEKALATLEDAKYSLVFSSGLSCFATVIHLLDSGDHIVSVDDLYGGTSRLFSSIATRMGITTTYVDATDPENVAQNIKSNTKMVWLETPSNPLLKVVDIQKISELTHKVNKDIIVVVDNTFLTPYFQRPLQLGADLSVMSLSKFMNGHHDVLMGSATYNSDEIHDKLYFLQYAMGTVPSPTDCHKLHRSLKTLPLRMDKHQQNALRIAKYLQDHPKIEKVMHPLLKDHPQIEITEKQAKGHSGMISFVLVGDIKQTCKFLSSLKMIDMATSLGGCASTILNPGMMLPTINKYVASELLPKTQSIPEKLLRMSTGIEDANDLIRDIEQALEKAFQ